MLENRIDNLKSYILTMEDNVKFLKQIIASQNETIKTFASNIQQEKKETPQQITLIEDDTKKVIEPETHQVDVIKASSMIRRRAII